ncbi:MAG: hypothetical protein VR65_10650 [Desulfobulbaceae bacterium BRH_c16a]|nr:MAG: hypothetical protein VR65_10650 [Desulfobulbaceae bacterium BRH_c16a]
MEIISTLLGYPISMFANVSTDYLKAKFDQSNIENVYNIFHKSFIEGVNSFDPKNEIESGVKIRLIILLRRKPEKLKIAIGNISYEDLTIANLRSDNFIKLFLKNLASEYSISALDSKGIGERIANCCFKLYEENLFNEITGKTANAMISTTLNKLYNNVAKKEDIEKLRAEILDKYDSTSQENDEIFDLMIEEIGCVESELVSESITKRMKELDKIVTRLTEDQFRVLNHQRYHKRLLVKGCAGSGKTIVAVERAIRLSEAGMKVLITCFNPYLANHIKSLTKGNNIDVISFNKLINSLIRDNSNGDVQEWNIYSEPTSKEIDKAFDEILSNKVYYDAVIVDEGQDFKEHWWLIIEAFLENSNGNILFIFADDKQQFGYQKTKYPLKQSPFYLSKNVRNAGKIYDLIKQFHEGAPPPSAFLEGFGITKVENLVQSNIIQVLVDAINYSSTYVDIKDIAILALSEEFKQSIGKLMVNSSFSLSSAIEQKINEHLNQISRNLLKRESSFKISFPLNNEQLSKISSLIKDCEKRLPQSYQHSSAKFYWQKSIVQLSDRVNKLEYNLYERRSDGRKNETKMAEHYFNLYSYYKSPNWSKNLPNVPVIRFLDEKIIIDDSNKSIPVLTIADYKGLEARGIILIIDRPVQDIETFLYVGISRAVFYLHILIDPKAASYIRNTGRNLEQSYEQL